MDVFNQDKAYEEFLENGAEEATEDIKKYYNGMHEAFENYICAVQEHMWKQGFKCGLSQKMV